MALPCPVDRLIHQPLSYTVSNCPIIEMAVAPDTANYIPYIELEVINNITNQASMGPLRTFTYNLLAENYFNNREFHTLAKNVINYFSHLMRSGRYDPERAIAKAVPEMITFYIGNLIYVYYELSSYLDNDALDICKVKAAEYRALLPQIEQAPPMYAPVQQNNYQVQPVNRMNAPLTSGGFQGGIVSNRPVVNTNAPLLTYASDRRFSTPAPVQQEAFDMYDANSMFGRPVLEERVSLSQKLFAIPGVFNRHDVAPVVEKIDIDDCLKEELKDLALPVSDELKFRGGRMNRGLHQIHMLGNAYKADTVIKAKELNIAAEALAVPAEPDEVNICLHGTVIANPHLDMIIDKAKIYYLDSELNKNNVNAFRVYGITANPFISYNNLFEYVDSLTKFTSLSKLATKIKSLVLSASAIDDEALKQEVIAMFSKLDLFITSELTIFIQTELALPIKFDSYLEDFDDICSMVANEYGSVYRSRLADFELKLINNIFYELSDHVKTLLNEFIELPNCYFTSYFPNLYSVTLVNITDKELDYDVQDKPLIINESRMPELYSLASSISVHDKEIGMEPLTNILVTSDDVRYRIYKNPVTNNLMIGKL